MKTKTFVLLMTGCVLGMVFAIYLIMFHPYTIECRLETGKAVKVRYYLGNDSKIIMGLYPGDSIDLEKMRDDSLEYMVVEGHAPNGSIPRMLGWVTRARVTKVPE